MLLLNNHAGAPGLEAAGLTMLGYSTVNVAQKATIGLSGNKLSTCAATDVFPSATLSANGHKLFQYNQPSFHATHSNKAVDFGSPRRAPSTTGRQPRTIITDTTNKMRAFVKFGGYIAVKWAVFYTYQFLEGNSKWDFRKANGEGLFLAAFMLLALPLLEIVLFFLPVRLSFQQSGWIRLFILTFVFCLEFVLGWYATNQNLEAWMVVKIVLGILLFLLFYRKQLMK